MRGVGRERESAVLDDALKRAAGGRGGLVRIVGEPGVGKTWLASHLHDRAIDRDIACVWARAWERAAAVPYGIIGDLLQALRRMEPEADDRALRALRPGAARSRERSFAEVVEALTSRRRPLLALVDDLHAADLDSLELLLALAPALRTSQTLVVATQRSVETGAGDEATSLLDAIARVSSAVDVGGLEAADVMALAAQMSGRPIDERVANAVHRATLGNALFVEGVLRRAARDGTLEQGTIRIPADLRRAINARVDAAGAATARVLRVAAAIGRPATTSLIAAAMGTDRDSIDAALEIAVDAGLLAPPADGLHAFRHTLVADALTASLSPSERASLHAAVGAAIEAGGGAVADVEELARHYALGVVVVGLDAALTAIDRAADHAASILAYEEAIRHRRQALALVESHAPSDSARRMNALLALGDAWLRAGRRTDARGRLVEAVVLARELGDSVAFARAALGIADTGEFGAVDREKIALLEEAASLLGATSKPLEAKLKARLAAEMWAAPENAKRRSMVSLDAVTSARELGGEPLFHALDARFQALWGPSGRSERRTVMGELRSLHAALGDAGQPIERALAIHRHALFLALEDGDIATFSNELGAMSEIGRQVRRPSLDETLAQRRLALAVVRGDTGEARRLIADVVELGNAIQNPQVEMGRAFVSSLVAADAGRADELASCVDVLAVHADRLAHLVFLRARLASALALLGRTADAQRELDTIVDQALPRLDDGLPTMATLALSAEAAWILGDRRAAESLASMIGPFADRAVAVGSTIYLGSAQRYVGLLAWTVGAHDRAIEALEHAHRDHERAGSPPWIARSASELVTLRRLRGHDDAHGVALEGDIARMASRGVRPLGVVQAFRMSEPVMTEASLLRAGQVWTLTFAGTSIRLRDAKGVRLLATLLATPGREHHALDLVGAAEIRSTAAASGDLGPVLDSTALAAYRRRIAELEEARSDAEARGATSAELRAREEIEALEDELSRSAGLGGRTRLTGAPERARVAVAKAFERTFATIGKDHPEALAHLSRAVRTGLFCSYDPDPATRISWNVTT